MNVSCAWLRALAPDLVDTPARMAERLASYGAAVDEIVEVGAGLGDIVIARVLESGRHPNADRLSLCQVDAGGETLQVVCGARNVRAGAFYPFARVGAALPGGIAIRRAKIRGQDSQGMLCSARELGLGRDHEGIMELHGTFEPGQNFLDAIGLRDVRLVVDVTPNRTDLLSHWGIARELAPQGEASLTLAPFGAAGRPAVAFARADTEAEAEGIRVRIEDAVGCTRYYGVAVRGVRVAPSPEWLAARLRAIGQRPINNIVDATNFVLHELGQPLHAFDLDRLGNDVVVRRARAGERLVTLDGVERRLDPAMLLIADATRPVALAGVMGGLDTEVAGDTTNLLLECALFDTALTRSTRKRAGLSTDASQRFERGVDPDGMERAVLRALALILAVAGGTLPASAPAAGHGAAAPPSITLRPARVKQILGQAFEPEVLASLLGPIGFRTERANGALLVRVPGHRRYDVAREEDLVEEVARRHGYDRFPDEIRPFRLSSVPADALAQLENRLRTLLVGAGMLEARSAAFAPEHEGDVALLLPLSAAESRLRRALLPGLLRRVEANFNRGQRDIRLFEIGTAFARTDTPMPAETTRLAIAFTGLSTPAHWSGSARPFDRWDMKGLAGRVAVELGLELRPAGPTAPATPELVERDAWTLLNAGKRAGGAGAVRPDAVDAPAWAYTVFGLEVVLDDAMARAPHAYRALAIFPAVERDVALVVPEAVPAAAVQATIEAAAGPLLEHAEVFDVYTGEQVSRAGTRSIAFRLRFQADDRTLVDEEVDAILERILARLREEHDVERRI
jgi:phenylalanyl-tRNA synthetase beta chain